MGFLYAVWCHLIDGSVCHASNQLFALGAPCRAAHLRAESWSVLSRHQLALRQIRHEEIAIVCDNRAKPRVRHWVGDQGSERFAIGAELEGGLRGPLSESLDIVYCETAARFGRKNQVLFVGGEGELRDPNRKRHLGLGVEWPHFTVAIRLPLKGFPYRLGCGDVNSIGASRSD
jgi:hypothetical protein